MNYSFTLWLPLTNADTCNPCIPRGLYSTQQRRYGYYAVPSAPGQCPQPEWQFVGNLGDASPEYGQILVFVDATGTYPPEVVTWDEFPDGDNSTVSVYRFRCEPCTCVNGCLSDNSFHPLLPAWFASDLDKVAECMGGTMADMIDCLISSDPLRNAGAWLDIGSYHGMENLDSYPDSLTLAQVRERYGVYTERGNAS